ncbi:PC4 and SFRS1-interacting protein [Leguminivora glycinivorella]|uniref:PC4 and SFRS1-interacting protein n=1 Tax=Leguminivora glycinivorella TaxID=1035111 RepID=UPI00200BEF7E|nr:PC4 and SFRS1-interacting protein [Leguminivora glycinivorella]
MKMGKKVREYKSGDFIFAKVKGYPAWPARVQKQNGKKYFVYFYGTGETANLPPNMIFDYAENKDKFLNKSVKRKDFNDGVKQIEHDFANNVPLEQVIGALAEAEPAAADDSMNETANETADSAIDTTAADETMDETANDGPVEDSDDAGALVIDEGKAKGRKSTAKPAATPKAKEPKTPRGRPKKEEKDAKEEDEDKKDEEIVSRSGRKIKPGKRYMDEHTEENATLPSPAPKKRRGASPSAEKEKEVKEKPQDRNIKAYNTVQQSELRELKEPFKSVDPEKENILITYLPSGQYCGVKLFQSRPASFKSEASRLQWDKQAASNAITLKKQLEKGQITPQSISAQLVMDLNLTDDERQSLDRDRDLEVKKSRLHFLKTEMKLIELDAKIKTCLSLEKADTELCLKLIDEILELDLAALMLLKHPTCMETVKRMRVYVGNAPSWEMSEAEALTFSKQAHRIRKKADALFITMRDLFHVPEGLSFWELFNERVAQFKAATENLHADKLLEMVNEPIELSQPIAHTMKAAVDAANEQEAAESDDADKKKKATPAKGKKANSTPAKQPLKRGRKPAQEDKEKETEKEPTEDKAEEPDANKPNENDKTDETEAPKENNENDAEKAIENDKDDAADKEVEQVNENSEKNHEDSEEKGEGDSEKTKDDAKDKETNDESKTNDKDNDDKIENDKDEDGKKSKDDKNSDKSKENGKNKEKPKEDAKNGNGKAKAADKRKDKSEKEQSVEKEKVDGDEPRAKRSRESKKTEPPPPRSPAKRKSRS